mgnify:CR=1 FL=1
MPFQDPAILAIEQLSQQISDILLSTQEILINDLYSIGTKIDPADLIQLNGQGIMQAKTLKASQLYEQGHEEILGQMVSFPSRAVSETTLQALKTLSTNQFMSTVNQMGDIMFNEITKGLMTGMTRNEIYNMVQGISGFKDYQIKTMINTQFGNFSRAVTTNMMQGMPENALYRYIGPIDKRTRDECRKMYLAGGRTKKEIETAFGKDVLSIGGGWNCRHRWTFVDEEYQLLTAGYDKFSDVKKAVKTGNLE